MQALVSCLAVLLLAWPSLAAENGVAEVEACMRANMPAKTAVQDVELRSADRLGGERTLDAKIYWKRSDEGFSRTLVEVEGPAEDRGSMYLWIEHADRSDAFVYLPEIRRVRRIHPKTASGSMFGTDFSYEDIQHLQKISGDARSAERLPDTELEGRPAFRVDVTPASEEGSSYRRIAYTIDRETCVPLEIRFYEEAETPRKVLRSDPEAFAREGEGWIARSVEMRDLVQETQTQLDVEKIELDAKVPDRLFTVTHLEKRAR